MFARKKRKVPALNTTSTADISFMLLIFFLVTSSMDTEKGLPRQLPPPPDSAEEQQLKVKERNVLQLKLDAQGQLSCNGEPVTVAEVTKRVEEFVANSNDNASLPEKSVRDVNLLGRCKVSDRHVIAIEADRATTYDAYFQLQNAVVMGYARLRNQLAKKAFGHPYAQCSPDERAALVMVYPQRISEEIPTEEGGEP